MINYRYLYNLYEADNYFRGVINKAYSYEQHQDLLKQREMARAQLRANPNRPVAVPDYYQQTKIQKSSLASNFFSGFDNIPTSSEDKEIYKEKTKNKLLLLL